MFFTAQNCSNWQFIAVAKLSISKGLASEARPTLGLAAATVHA
jgi:hypothetical protein